MTKFYLSKFPTIPTNIRKNRAMALGCIPTIRLNSSYGLTLNVIRRLALKDMTIEIRTGLRLVADSIFNVVGETAAYLHRMTGFGHLSNPASNGVLLYHGVGEPAGTQVFGNISVDRFRSDVRYLVDEFEVVPLREIANQGTTRRIAVTFDDGLRSVHRNALPVLREFDVPATVFVSPGFIGDRNRELLSERHNIVPSGRTMMNQDEIAALVDDPLIDIGNHTRTHPHLGRIESSHMLYDEVVDAKRCLEEQYGITVESFSYPFGDYNEEAREIVEDSHCVSVLTTPYLVYPPASPHLLPRISGHLSPNRLRWELAPLSDTMNRVRY